MVVRGRKLVDHASRRLDREGIDHGVLMAGHWRVRPRARIHLCSIDSLHRRKELPEADLVVIDEAHNAASKGYHWLVSAYPDAFFLPVTATPYVRKSLRHVAQEIVRPTNIKDLIAEGFLVPPKYYAPSVPDLTGVKTSAGDYLDSDLERVLNKHHLIGDIVKSWIRYGESRPTLCFAITKNHSRAIVETFLKAGISAEHVDADSSDKQRQAVIDRLENGETKVVSNVGILNVGVDIPPLSCIISARPTKSYALWIQVAGRGTRPFPGKSDFIIIDHGGNVLRHGCILEERQGSLDPMPKGKRGTPDNLTTCVCYGVFSRMEKYCPSCGALNTKCPAVVKEEKAKNPIDADLEIADAFHIKIVARRGEYRDEAKRRGYKKGWVFYKLKEEFGEEVANKYEPKRKIPEHILRKLRGTSANSIRDS